MFIKGGFVREDKVKRYCTQSNVSGIKTHVHFMLILAYPGRKGDL
jgi:hypothetical protein